MNSFHPIVSNSQSADCAAALEVWDLIRPGETDPERLAWAAQHLETCADCRRVVAERRRFDTRVTRLLRDVVVPADGAEQLLRRLAGGPGGIAAVGGTSLETVAPRPAEDQASLRGPRSVDVGRRRVLRRALAALLLLLGLAGVVFWNRVPTATVRDIVTALARLDWNAPGLPELLRLQDGRPPLLPKEMNTDYIDGAPRQLAVQRVQAAVFFFQFPRRGVRNVQAALAVIPVGQMAPGPRGSGFLAGPPLVEGGLVATTWIEGDVAYVCCVRGTSSDLQELAVPRPAA